MIAEAFSFPEINSILRWKDLFPTFNKIAIIAVAAAVIGSMVFILAGRKNALEAPKGVRNLAETTVEFIENGIVMQTMGKSGLGWTPFLLSLFIFIYLCNVPGIIPFLQMPATARMAIPMFLALLVWVIYNGVGIKHQGFFGYFKSTLFPPGVPKALYILVTPIEFISNILVRPFSLMVRLFANMLAGHILLVTFSVLTLSLLLAETMQFALVPLSIAPFFGLVAFTAFEIMVSFLQAYIFALLAGVYIGGALHPAH